MTPPDWTNSKTNHLELWKNPLLPINERLEIADGVIANQQTQIDRLRNQLQPKHHGQWIVELIEAIFVVFDPTTDGTEIVGACRYLHQAEQLLNDWMKRQ